MSDLQYCPHCNSYHPASTSMTGCMRAPMAVTSGRHIVPPSLFLDQIEYVTRAEADAMVAAERERVKALVEAAYATLDAIDKYNVKNGTHIIGGPPMRLAKALAALKGASHE